MQKGLFSLSCVGGKRVDTKETLCKMKCCQEGAEDQPKKKRFKKNYQKILRIKKIYYHMRAELVNLLFMIEININSKSFVLLQ